MRPAENGTLESYDPWQIYQASETNKGTPPPYQSLLELPLSLGAFGDDKVPAWRFPEHIVLGSLKPEDESRRGALDLDYLEYCRTWQFA